MLGMTRAKAVPRPSIIATESAQFERGYSGGLATAIHMVEHVLNRKRISAEQEKVLLEVYDLLWAEKDHQSLPHQSTAS